MSPGGGPATLRRVTASVLLGGLLVVTAACDSTTTDPRSSAPSSTPTPTTAGTTTAAPTAATVTMSARPRSDGHFLVVEQVRFDVRVRRLVLAPPDLSAVGGFARLEPAAIDVRLRAGGRSVDVPKDRVRRQIELTLPRPVRRIELRYTLTGVSVRSRPAPTGRALAALGPPLTQVASDSPVRIRVRGNLRNLTCPHREDEQSCSTGTPPRLGVDKALPQRVAVVKIQLDLPRSG